MYTCPALVGHRELIIRNILDSGDASQMQDTKLAQVRDASAAKRATQVNEIKLNERKSDYAGTYIGKSKGGVQREGR